MKNIYKYLTYVALTFLSSCATEKGIEAKSSIACDPWTYAEGVDKSKPLTIKFRDCGQSILLAQKFPKLIKVSWEFQPNEFGMPSNNISNQMSVFENRLGASLQDTNTGVLVAVVTTEGFREWAVYSTSIPVFGNAMSRMPKASNAYPVYIEATDDPDWEFLNAEIRSGLVGNVQFHVKK